MLPGTSRLTWNLAGFYEAHGIQTRLSAEYVSEELFSLGGSKAFDVIQDARLTVDFTASYRVLPNWTIYFNAKNLTDEPLRFFYGQGRSFPVQREIYDVTYEGGIRARF
jgi:outer membrane receptor protein involved in Fe transport